MAKTKNTQQANTQTPKNDALKATYKRLPRFASNEAKKRNIVDFIDSMEVTKTKDGKIKDFKDFFLFSNIATSVDEIMRNEDLLDDRNIKTSVHTLVSSSKTSRDLAYIAENIDSVLESIRDQVARFGNESDFKALTEAAKTWEETQKSVETQIEKLKSVIDSSLEKGYGSRFQLRKYEYTKFENNKAEIEKLLNSKKEAAEIADKLGVKIGFIQDLDIELGRKRLEENRDSIKKKLLDSTPRQEIADELRVSKKRLNKFITDNKLDQKPKEVKKTPSKPDIKTETKKVEETKEVKAKTAETKAA